MKNVLMVIDSLEMGGAERIVLTLTGLFLKKNINVDIIMIYDKIEYNVSDNINIYSINYKKRYFQTIIYRNKLRKKIEILEEKYGQPYNLILVHLLKASKLMNNYIHNNMYYVIHNTMSAKIFNRLDGNKRKRKLKRIQKKFNNKNLIAVSQGVAEDLKLNMQIKSKSIQVIYNPIDVELIEELAKDENTAQKYSPYIIHIGKFHKQKRHDILINAYMKSNIDAKLVLVGDGDLRRDIENIIKKYSLENRVIMMGLHKNPYPILNGASLLVLSSDHEGLPTVILEALSLNIPVVSRDCPSGPKEILANYNNDFLADYNNIDDFSRKIKRQYETKSVINPNIIDRFHGETVLQQYIELMG